MTSPKRAEPANEHAKRLLDITKLTSEDMERYSLRIERACFAAAAEIERLAARVREAESLITKNLIGSTARIQSLEARVRELEERPRYDVAELRGKIVSSVKDNPIEAQRVHDTLAAIHGFVALERPWLPIASAPRDGTRVELWITIGPRPYAIYGGWQESGQAWYSDSGVVLNTPTHWRPEPLGPRP